MIPGLLSTPVNTVLASVVNILVSGCVLLINWVITISYLPLDTEEMKLYRVLLCVDRKPENRTFFKSRF